MKGNSSVPLLITWSFRRTHHDALKIAAMGPPNKKTISIRRLENPADKEKEYFEDNLVISLR